jgi:chemotaxis protein methyltransferase CheR
VSRAPFDQAPEVTSTTWTHPDYEALIELFSARTGIRIAPDRHTYAEEAVERCMRRARVATLPAYRDRVQNDDDAFDDLLSALVVPETYFFREPSQFLFIRRAVLPGLRSRGSGRPIRMWSAGCASGEEAYSLAILATQEGIGERTNILATDISPHAIDRARRGSYRAWSLRGDAAAEALPYLERVGQGYVVDERIKALVEFRQHNLMTDLCSWRVAGIDQMDVILCRNVLIYFGSREIDHVARGLFDSLAAGGWLIAGPSDPPLGDIVPFETRVAPEGVFYRRAPEGAGASSPCDTAHPRKPHPRIDDPAAPGAQVAAASPGRVPAIDDVLPRAALAAGSPTRGTETFDEMAEAHRALAKGDYVRAAELTRHFGTNASMGALHVRALTHLDEDRAERTCVEAIARFPLCAELHHIHGVLLLALGRDAAAEHSLRRALYLDRTLAICHFVLGLVLKRQGDAGAAHRAFRNAHRLFAALPPDALVPLADGEQAGRLAHAAAAEISSLGAIEAPAR